MEPVQPGLYEAIITERLKKALAASGLKHEFEKLDKADSILPLETVLTCRLNVIQETSSRRTTRGA